MSDQMQPSDVQHEQPTTKIKSALDQILHFWPLLTFLGLATVAIASTLGRVYVSDIADERYAALKTADPVINGIMLDIATIKTSLGSQEANDVEIRVQLGNIESRLDTLIRIQLEE